jgi:hypothetical protein
MSKAFASRRVITDGRILNHVPQKLVSQTDRLIGPQGFIIHSNGAGVIDDVISTIQ